MGECDGRTSANCFIEPAGSGAEPERENGRIAESHLVWNRRRHVLEHDRMLLEGALSLLVDGGADSLPQNTVTDLEPLDVAANRNDGAGDVAAEDSGIAEPREEGEVLQQPVERIDGDGRVADQDFICGRNRQIGAAELQLLSRSGLPGSLVGNVVAHLVLLCLAPQVGARLSATKWIEWHDLLI
jgi:hypothetical protein